MLDNIERDAIRIDVASLENSSTAETEKKEPIHADGIVRQVTLFDI